MNRFQHRLFVAVSLLYVVAVLLIAFWPVPVDSSMSGGLETTIGWLHTHGLPKFIGYEAIEFTANILFFIPLGLLVRTWTKRSWVAILTGMCMSISIELIQELVLPQRFSSVLDILANTLGAIIGSLLLIPLSRFSQRYFRARHHTLAIKR